MRYFNPISILFDAGCFLFHWAHSFCLHFNIIIYTFDIRSANTQYTNIISLRTLEKGIGFIELTMLLNIYRPFVGTSIESEYTECVCVCA